MTFTLLSTMTFNIEPFFQKHVGSILISYDFRYELCIFVYLDFEILPIMLKIHRDMFWRISSDQSKNGHSRIDIKANILNLYDTYFDLCP